jgi:hypothetical protein
MISRSGTRRSGASSGTAKILRDEGSGPVVTAGSVVSGLERMFMGSSCEFLFIGGVAFVRHCERSEAIQSDKEELDCFVASLLAMTEVGVL